MDVTYQYQECTRKYCSKCSQLAVC